MTELFGVVIMLEERSGTMGERSMLPGTSLKKMLVSFAGKLCSGGKAIPRFQRHEVDPSSAFGALSTAIGISMPD